MSPRFPASDEISGRDAPFRRSLMWASVFFGALVLLDLVLIGVLLFRDLDKRAVVDSLARARIDAEGLAESVGRVTAPSGGFDYYRIFEREQVLYRVFNEFMARCEVVRHIEVRDPAGNPVLSLKRGETKIVTPLDEAPFGFAPPGPEGNWPDEPGDYVVEGPVRERLVKVPMPGGPVGATLQLGVAEESLEEQARRLRRSLLIELGVGGVLSLLLLVAAFAYVLRLLRRVRRAEADRQIAGRLAYVGTLASGLAHEIRNPLNAMNINLQMLDEELGEKGADEETLSLLAASREEVRRLEGLVQDFLAYARPGRTALSPQDPQREVSTVVDFLRPQFDDAGIGLEHRPAQGVPAVPLDADQFRQALLNILQNALQASPPGAAVEVRTAVTEEGGFRVEVQDRGPGIPPDRLEKVFEVFYSNRPGGTGLGLPIAQRVLEAHGGEIEVKSTLGEGTTVILVLPPEASADAEAGGSEEPAPAGTGS